MATYDVTTASAEFEWFTTDILYAAAATIDSTHVLVTYYDSAGGGDGFAQVLTINASTFAVTTASAAFEFDTQNYNPAATVIKIDTNHFFIWYCGGAGFYQEAQVLAVDTSTWAVTTAAARLEVDTIAESVGYACKIDTNHILVQYGDGFATGGYTRVLTINTTTWVVTTATSTTLSNGSKQAQWMAVMIDDNHALAVWSASGSTGKAQVLTINTSTWAVTTAAASYEFATFAANPKPVLAKIDDTHYLVGWMRNTGSQFNLMVLAVDTSTWAVSAAGSEKTLFSIGTTVEAMRNIQKIDANHFALFTGSSDTTGQGISMLTINTSTWAITTTNARFDWGNPLDNYGELVSLGNSKYVAVYSGTDSDGFAQVLSVEYTAPTTSTATPISNALLLGV